MKLNIQDKLKEKNMTRYELAKRINVTYPTIQSIYKGDSTSIKFEILENICKTLECSPNEIIITDDPDLRRIYANYSHTKNFIKKDDTN
jgi:putative transcriptional regulator